MDRVYRGFDRLALDREYSPSAALPGGIAPYLDRYASLSAQAMAGPGVIPDVAYGAHPDEVLDLFLPDGEGPWPLHVFIHGGFWQALGQRDFAFFGPAFQKRHVAYASVNYTLAPAATIGEMVGQCTRALGWLYARADEYRLDRGRFALSGHSAGAHLAAMLLAADWPALGLPADIVSHVLLISGIYDLEPIRLCYVNGPLGLSADQVASWSPLRLDPRTDCPATIVWGENDTGEFKRQSIAFADALSRRGNFVERAELGGRNHFDILFELLKETVGWQAKRRR